mmetsp:Transcript_9384/g.26793  ORF Transcript_9384/g.26793 Transcript_9384/m.26793 type:complete len:259 (-) Transcript_9384:413-1189(-)
MADLVASGHGWDLSPNAVLVLQESTAGGCDATDDLLGKGHLFLLGVCLLIRGCVNVQHDLESAVAGVVGADPGLPAQNIELAGDGDACGSFRLDDHVGGGLLLFVLDCLCCLGWRGFSPGHRCGGGGVACCCCCGCDLCCFDRVNGSGGDWFDLRFQHHRFILERCRDCGGGGRHRWGELRHFKIGIICLLFVLLDVGVIGGRFFLFCSCCCRHVLEDEAGRCCSRLDGRNQRKDVIFQQRLLIDQRVTFVVVVEAWQ